MTALVMGEDVILRFTDRRPEEGAGLLLPFKANKMTSLINSCIICCSGRKTRRKLQALEL